MSGTKATTLSVESIEQYRNWCFARNRAVNTVKAYTSDLNEFLKAVGESFVPMEEYEDLAMIWLNSTKASLSPKTIGRRLTSLRGFAKWAGVAHPLEDYIAPTPGRAIPHPLPEGLDGVRRMISKAKNHQQVALIALCGYVGLRIAEALSIKTTDIDVQTMQLTVRGKGDKTRTIPISDSAWTYLSSAYVSAMGTEDHRLIHYRDRFARKIVTNLGAAAGLQRPVASHDLRATFATAVYDHTLDIRAVQELLGHSSSVTTEGYTMITLNTLKKAVDL